MNNLESFFKPHKESSMTKEEKEASWKAISARTFDAPISNLNISKDDTVRKPLPSRLYYGGWLTADKNTNTIASSSFAKKKYTLGIIAGVLIVSGGVSAFAQTSLPGDLLYPIKTSVNEKVQVALALDTESKANLEATLATRRLEEQEKLALDGKLSDALTLKTNEAFHSHMTKFEKELSKLEKEENYDAIVQVGSALQTRVAVHAAILKDMEVNRHILNSASSTPTQLAKRKKLKKTKTTMIESDSQVATTLQNKVLPATVPTITATQKALIYDPSHASTSYIDGTGTVVFVGATATMNGTATKPVLLSVDKKKARQYLKKLKKDAGSATVIGGSSTTSVPAIFVP